MIGRTKYPLDVIELEHHEEVRFDDFVIASFPVNHRVEAYGYAFIEDDRPGPLRRRGGARARRHRGPGLRPPAARRDRQRRHARAGRRGGPAGAPDRLHGRHRARASPSRSTPHDADVLVHEATFCEDERDRARETGHSTAAPGRPNRRDAGVKLLALTHLSTRYFPREIRDEARERVREHRRPARLRRDRGPVPGARRAAAREDRTGARAVLTPC